MIFLRRYRRYTIMNKKILIKIAMIENKKGYYNVLGINQLVFTIISKLKDSFILDMTNRIVCIMNHKWEVQIDNNIVYFIPERCNTCYISYIKNRSYTPILDYRITVIAKYNKNNEIKQYYITNYQKLALIKIQTYDYRSSNCIV